MGLRTVVGSASLKAEDWVDAFQNPFGKTLSSIYDPLLKASQSGTLNYGDVSGALDQFNQQWAAFDQAAQQWRDKGGDYKKVVGQSYDPNGAFMQTVNMVKNALTGWVNTLKPPDAGNPTGATTPPTGKTVLGGISPQTVADAAALRQQRQAAAGGQSSTILTSYNGTAGAQVNLKRSTILGYAA